MIGRPESQPYSPRLSMIPSPYSGRSSKSVGDGLPIAGAFALPISARYAPDGQRPLTQGAIGDWGRRAILPLKADACEVPELLLH